VVTGGAAGAVVAGGSAAGSAVEPIGGAAAVGDDDDPLTEVVGAVEVAAVDGTELLDGWLVPSTSVETASSVPTPSSLPAVSSLPPHAASASIANATAMMRNRTEAVSRSPHRPKRIG
jgi:hypothetical protein